MAVPAGMTPTTAGATTVEDTGRLITDRRDTDHRDTDHQVADHQRRGLCPPDPDHKPGEVVAGEAGASDRSLVTPWPKPP